MLDPVRQDHETLGEFLRRLREQRGLTLRELGAMTGIHYTTLGAWERDENEPGARRLRKLAYPLGVAPEVLLHALNVLPERSAADLAALSARDDPLSRVQREITVCGWGADIAEGVACMLAKIPRRTSSSDGPHSVNQHTPPSFDAMLDAINRELDSPEDGPCTV